MARIRTLKPEILEDEKTAGLSLAAYKLFTGLIVLSDDHGNSRSSAAFLRAQIFWANEEIGAAEVESAVSELESVGLAQRYTVKGQTYVTVIGWSKHQRIDNAGKNRVPPISEADGCGNPPRNSEDNGEPPRFAAGPKDPDPDQRTKEPSADCRQPPAQGPDPLQFDLVTDEPASKPKMPAKPSKKLSVEKRAEWYLAKAEESGTIAQVEEVCEVYKTEYKRVLPKSRPNPSAKARGLVAERLTEKGTTVERLVEAIKGCMSSDFHVRGGHTGLALICRDSDKVEEMRQKFDASKSSPAGRIVDRTTQDGPYRRPAPPVTMLTPEDLKRGNIDANRTNRQAR